MIAVGMGPASGRLRGTGRRGGLAGAFAVLLVALAAMVPGALADGQDSHADDQGTSTTASQTSAPGEQSREEQSSPSTDGADDSSSGGDMASEGGAHGNGKGRDKGKGDGRDSGKAKRDDAVAGVEADKQKGRDHGRGTPRRVADPAAQPAPAPPAPAAEPAPAAAPVPVPSAPPRQDTGGARADPRRVAAAQRRAAARRTAAARRRAAARAHARPPAGSPAASPAVGPTRRAQPAPEVARGAGDRSRPRPAASRPPAEHDRGDGLRFVPVILRALANTVQVVPRMVWLALAALALLAIGLAGFAVTRDRRARRLVREREALLADLHALEGAVVPSLPESLGGVALSVASAPAVGPVAGGDFHDAFALSGDRVAVLVGDVAGHGRQALADAQLVRHAVRAYLEAGLDPRTALAMTGAVVDERAEPLFASVLVAVHDRRDGTLTYASAGHEPPVLVTEQGAGLPPVSGWSPPLGTGLETGRRQTTVPLPQGQAVCLLTDGVTEARSEGVRLGMSRVIRWLSALGPAAGAHDIVARLREEADVQEDDVTVCLLRALTPAAPDSPRVEEAVVEGGDPTYLIRFLRDCGLPLADAQEAGEALATAPDGTRMVASVTINGGRAVVELAPLRGSGSSHETLVG